MHLFDALSGRVYHLNELNRKIFVPRMEEFSNNLSKQTFNSSRPEDTILFIANLFIINVYESFFIPPQGVLIPCIKHISEENADRLLCSLAVIFVLFSYQPNLDQDYLGLRLENDFGFKQLKYNNLVVEQNNWTMRMQAETITSSSYDLVLGCPSVKLIAQYIDVKLDLSLASKIMSTLWASYRNAISAFPKS